MVRKDGEGRAAFSLLELLVVLAIIGILASISLPALRGLNKSGSIDAAVQQMLDDLALARARAIGGRTTVHVLFVPPTNNLPDTMAAGPYRTYGFFAERTVGDQPGQPHFRYLGDWKTLPQGILLATSKFDPNVSGSNAAPFLVVEVPFPNTDTPLTTNTLPHVAFGPEGGLVYRQGLRRYEDEIIELVQGSVLVQRDESTGNLLSYDVRHTPGSTVTQIRIDAFTGRAEVRKLEIE